METLIGSTICSPQHESAYWEWVGLLTDEGVVQLLIRGSELDAQGGLPPLARIAVQGDWLRMGAGDKPWFFVVNRLEVVEWPRCGLRPSP